MVPAGSELILTDRVYTLQLQSSGLELTSVTNGAKQSRQPQPGHGLVGIQQMAPREHTSDKQAYYSFIDPGRMKG